MSEAKSESEGQSGGCFVWFMVLGLLTFLAPLEIHYLNKWSENENKIYRTFDAVVVGTGTCNVINLCRVFVRDAKTGRVFETGIAVIMSNVGVGNLVRCTQGKQDMDDVDCRIL